MPETHHKAHRSGGQIWYQTYLHLFSHRRYVGYLLILGCQFGALYGFLDIAPFIIRHYLHTSLILSGYLLMIGSMGMLLGAVTVLLWVKRIGINGLLKIGLSSALCGGGLLIVCAFMHSQATWLVIWPMALATYGFGICVPGCKAGAMTVFEANSGAASSMMKFMQIVLTNMVLLVIAHWHHANSLWPMAMMIVLLTLFAMGIFYGLIATKRRV